MRPMIIFNCSKLNRDDLKALQIALTEGCVMSMRDES